MMNALKTGNGKAETGEPIPPRGARDKVLSALRSPLSGPQATSYLDATLFKFNVRENLISAPYGRDVTPMRPGATFRYYHEGLGGT